MQLYLRDPERSRYAMEKKNQTEQRLMVIFGAFKFSKRTADVV